MIDAACCLGKEGADGHNRWDGFALVDPTDLGRSGNETRSLSLMSTVRVNSGTGFTSSIQIGFADMRKLTRKKLSWRNITFALPASRHCGSMLSATSAQDVASIGNDPDRVIAASPEAISL